jgi:hypothetical protein
MVSEKCVTLRFVSLGLDKDPLENRSCFVYKLLHTHYLVNSSLSHFCLYFSLFQLKDEELQFRHLKGLQDPPSPIIKGSKLKESRRKCLSINSSRT